MYLCIIYNITIYYKYIAVVCIAQLVTAIASRRLRRTPMLIAIKVELKPEGRHNVMCKILDTHSPLYVIYVYIIYMFTRSYASVCAV